MAITARDALDDFGQAEQRVPVAAQVRQLVGQGDGVESDDAVFRIGEPMQREDRHQTSANRAQHGREEVRAGELNDQLAR